MAYTAIPKSTTARFPQKRHSKALTKAIRDADSFTPAVAANWTGMGVTAPTTQDDALNSLAANVAAGGTLFASGTISSAQILALNATPVTLVAAPGAGKVIIVEQVQLFLDYGTAAYAGIAAGENLLIEYSGGADIAILETLSAGFLDATADVHILATPVSPVALSVNTVLTGILATTIDNEAVRVTIQTGEITTGDSPIKYEVKYRVVTQLV